MTVSQEDHALISAYHDGELNPPQVRQVRARLHREPDLQETLEDIREVSRALGGLRPSTVPADKPARKLSAGIKVAAAACLSAIMLFGALNFGSRSEMPATPSQWHAHFLNTPYSVADRLQPTPATRWIGLEPDLTTARLTLVDIAKSAEGDVYLHYSGQNGCRLTFGTHSKKPVIEASQKGALSATWSTSDMYYSVLAVGMDTVRFNAIAKLLQDSTIHQAAEEHLYAQARDATRRAIPCA